MLELMVKLVVLSLVDVMGLVAIFVVELLVTLVALVLAVLVTQPMFDVRKPSVRQHCLTHLVSPQ